MGLDIGQKRVGVAMSDESKTIAQPLKTINLSDLFQLEEIIKSFQVEEIIFGLPKNMNGSLGPQADKITILAEKIAASLNIPVKPWDERLTTVMAEKALIEGRMRREKRKGLRDSLAAAIILQGYLDWKKRVKSEV